MVKRTCCFILLTNLQLLWVSTKLLPEMLTPNEIVITRTASWSRSATHDGSFKVVFGTVDTSRLIGICTRVCSTICYILERVLQRPQSTVGYCNLIKVPWHLIHEHPPSHGLKFGSTMLAGHVVAKIPLDFFVRENMYSSHHAMIHGHLVAVLCTRGEKIPTTYL
jgi:hypothetical protein